MKNLEIACVREAHSVNEGLNKQNRCPKKRNRVRRARNQGGRGRT